MDTEKIILAIYIEQYTVYCSVFNGKMISLIIPFIDSFVFKFTIDVMDKLNPSLILVDTMIGFSPILTKQNIKKFKKVKPSGKRRVFRNLNKGENRSLEILSTYFHTTDKIYIDHYKTIGYIGSYSIERINMNSFYMDYSSHKLIFENSKTINNLFLNLKVFP